jgi:CxxC motif-containing protein
MPDITANVKFSNIAREWRCKWSADADKQSLVDCQNLLDEVLVDLSSVEGVTSVQRVVCGGCLDFKIITKLSAEAFGKWDAAAFEPEATFLEKVKAIAGITAVETQTYTLEEVKASNKQIKSAKEKAKKAAGEEKEEAPAKELTPEEVEAARKKKLKATIKEGGKRGVEIEGAADMGGLQFFCTSVDEPEGDLALLEECAKAMNAKSDPTEEERKGGSGHIGKMVFSAGIEQLAVVAYVPAEKQAECNCEEWIKQVLSLYSGSVGTAAADYCTGFIKADGDKNIFPVKIRDSLILEANNFLRKKGLFPEDKDDDDDEMVFGDDDFPSM